MARKPASKPASKLVTKAARKPASKPTKKMAHRNRAKSIKIRDGRESAANMEPLLIGVESCHRAELSDKVIALTQKAAAFRSHLPEGFADPLASLVREMNCYYSNLIEGSNTHPVEIQRALFGERSTDPEKRDMQLEAIAHISVQRWIDDGGIDGKAITADVVYEIHRRFYDLLPDSLRLVVNPDTNERIKVIPGKARERDVQVGKHIPISPGAVRGHMERWESVYSKLGTFETIMNVAAAHHRLVWIHPFLDGNGRVARLVSYASLRDALDTAGLWSVARGLGVNSEKYKSKLRAADEKRKGDRDGRGGLSESALVEFTHFFLDICIDQVEFMERLMQPSALRSRIMTWLDDEIRTKQQHDRSRAVVDHVLFNGWIERSDLPSVTGFQERAARRVAQGLADVGILRASTDRQPYRLAFPAELAPRLMPGLYPPATSN